MNLLAHQHFPMYQPECEEKLLSNFHYVHLKRGYRDVYVLFRGDHAHCVNVRDENVHYENVCGQNVRDENDLRV